jgi:hypothetical protein
MQIYSSSLQHADTAKEVPAYSNYFLQRKKLEKACMPFDTFALSLPVDFQFMNALLPVVLAVLKGHLLSQNMTFDLCE